MRGGVKIEREDMSAQELRRLAGGVKDGRVSRRLLAMALVLEGASRKVAAESFGLDRQTLRDWVHRYNAQGASRDWAIDVVAGCSRSSHPIRWRNWRLGSRTALTRSEMVSCVGGGWLSRVGSRWFSASNFMSAR